MPAKPKHPRAAAREICALLKPVTERLIVAGSLRRRKPLVGDVEILYISKFAFGHGCDPSNYVPASLSVQNHSFHPQFSLHHPHRLRRLDFAAFFHLFDAWTRLISPHESRQGGPDHCASRP